jgi:O-antigen/teichoic acid export membrane protein
MKGLFKKFMEFAVGNAAVLVLGLLSTSIITRIILPVQIGKFYMFTTVTSLIVLVVMIGLDQSYIRYYHEEDAENRGKLLRQCIKIPLAINLCIGIVALVFYKPISNFIASETSLILVILVFVHTTFTIISNFVLINIRMKQRGKLYSTVTSMNKVFYIILALLFYTIFKNNYIVVVLSFVLANIAMVIMGVIFERKDWFAWSKDKKLKTDTNTLLNYGSPLYFLWLLFGISIYR